MHDLASYSDKQPSCMVRLRQKHPRILVAGFELFATTSRGALLLTISVFGEESHDVGRYCVCTDHTNLHSVTFGLKPFEVATLPIPERQKSHPLFSITIWSCPQNIGSWSHSVDMCFGPSGSLWKQTPTSYNIPTLGDIAFNWL